jgi:hypothetical protein
MNLYSGLVDSIFVIHNVLDGGYSGFDFHGITGRYTSHVVFDSNTVTNQTDNGVDVSFVDFASFSNNTISSSTVDEPYRWRGLFLHDCNGTVTNNRIVHVGISDGEVTGMDIRGHNVDNVTNKGLIANNEVTINRSASALDYTAAIALENGYAQIVHNSVYLSGLGQGFKIGDGTFEIKNNNLILADADAVPYGFTSASVNEVNDQCDIDYNNIYAQSYIAYIRDIYRTERYIITTTEWQGLMPTDLHSVRVRSSFVDSAQSLKLTDYTGLTCPVYPLVEKDREETLRLGASTTMGAYHGLPPLAVNASLMEVIGWREGVVSSDNISAKVTNRGTTTLTDITINWIFNAGTENTYTWNGSLANGQSVTIPLGSINYALSENTLEVWIEELNLGAETDGYPQDDTIRLQGYVCLNPMSGPYIIGTESGDAYGTVTDALNKLRICEAKGDITFKLREGVYNYGIDLSNISSHLNGYSLTLTSLDQNAAKVTIKPGDGAGITLSQSNNIFIKDITIDATATDATYAVQFTGACNNVEIRDCELLGKSNYALINKGKYTGIARNITIFHNKLDGGNYGFYFIDGTGTGIGQYGTNIVFDSNTVINQVSQGVHAEYVDFTSCSYNTIKSSTVQVINNTWTGIRMDYCNGPVIGNRIVPMAAYNGHNGIDARYYSYYNTTDTGLIANNEIIHKTASSGSIYGLYLSYVHAKVLHNSIYELGATGLTYGIRISNADIDILELKNNNVVLTKSDAYPVFVAQYTELANLTKFDIDYNNIYAPTNIAYVGGDITTMAAWQQLVPSDKHSVAVMPSFTDVTSSLELSASDSLLCEAHPDVTTDINNTARSAMTAMGAYTQKPSAHDAMLMAINNWEDRFIENQLLHVNVELMNLCDATNLTSAVLGWSINDIPQQNTPLTSLNLSPYQKQNVLVGSFKAPNENTLVVKVWVDSLNGKADTIHWNDTVSAVTMMEPLAEFVAPFVSDTISALSFTINTFIRTETGAPVSNPQQMFFHTVINGQDLYDTVIMTPQGSNIWQAQIKDRYYGSKVSYSTTIFGTEDDTVVLTGSTYILFTDTNTDRYAGDNLSLLALTEPVNRNISGNSCSDATVPLTIVMANTGSNDCDYTTNNVQLTAEVKILNPVNGNESNYSINKTLNSGILQVGQMDTVIIDSLFPVYMPGQYDIKVWLTSATDKIAYDDTLESVYISERTGLPIEKNFSSGGYSPEFTVTGLNTSAEWTVVSKGSGIDSLLKPVYGDSMLAFTGNRGAITHLSTRQLELRGTILPAMEFWYFHDTIASEDYMDVRITEDGGTTYTTLFSLLKQDTASGWKHYSVDLSPYVDGECINILFEAMQMSSGTGGQYIDSININSFPDLGVTEIIITPEITVCDRENRSIGIVLTAAANRAIDLDYYNTSLVVEIPKGSTEVIPLRKTIDRNSSDTVWINDVDLPAGENAIRAYLSVPVDIYPINDTLVDTINISPKLAVRLHAESTPMGCLTAEIKVNPTVTIYNIGNMDLSDIELIFQIDTGNNFNRYATFKEPCTTPIQAGDTLVYTFTNSYLVPWTANFYPRITAYLSCDSAWVSAVDETPIPECVNMRDLYMVAITNPSSATDRVGSSILLAASIHNRSEYDFSNASITVIVENSKRVQTTKFTEMTGNLKALTTVNHSFSQTYTVPNDSVYYLTVYIDSEDSYAKNDTLEKKRYTEGVGIESSAEREGFTLGQNIPNPANNRTRIDFAVPEAGQVIFHVHSISGQLLYSRTIEAERGNQSIELNTSTLAAGIYFYSVEYKGQRIVKRMSVR